MALHLSRATCISWGMGEAMAMGGSCGFRPKNNGTRTTGIVLMVVGVLMFLIFVPRWVWTSALGVCLISVGYLMWRFGGR